MEATVTNDGDGRFILSCPSEMEWNARSDLVKVVQQAVGAERLRGVIVDLAGVTFISSAGLGGLFTLRQHVEQAGAALVLCRPTPTIARLLRTVNLPDLLPVAATMADARQLISAGGGDAA